ncbi:MAG: tetratricopeptide repeat protein [Cyanobacteria bacterium J06648_16]
MSIDDDLLGQPSVTEGDRALQLFTDRYRFTRLLAERLNDPAQNQILFFYGPGGNGKSLLLRYLHKTMCKRLTAAQWQTAKALPDDQLAAKLATLPGTAHLPVPSALLDFGLTTLGEAQPKDRFYGLLLLRKALGESASEKGWRPALPRYDFACVWYLLQQGKSTEEIKSLFPLDAAGFVTGLLAAATGSAGGAIVDSLFGFFGEGLGQKFALYQARLKLGKQDFEAIRGLDVNTDLIDRMPEFLALDLNAAMAEDGAPARIALFFDTHEAFWGEQRNLPREQYFLRDEWLRRLLRKLDLSAGIVAVVAGRDVPQWPGAKAVRPKTEIPESYLHAVAVENLAVADARAYLQKVGISDQALAESLMAYASVGPDAVHPLHLGLCADVVLEAAAAGTPLTAESFATVPAAFAEKSEQLIERLLRYVNDDLRYAIHALSACRAFNFETYRLLGEKLSFTADRPTFDRLVRFSFIRQNQQRGADWYSLHDLMRRLNEDAQVAAAHGVLAEAYQAEGNIEAIYHVNRLDWSQGVDRWVNRFDDALELSRYELCRTLLELRPELTVASDFKLGLISNAEGQYYQVLSQYPAAQREYQEAIDAYSRDLETAPDSTATLNNKGLALQSLADLQAALSQHQQAQQTYRESIAAYNAALERAPDDVGALNNKGNSLSRLADLQAALSQHQQAQQSYTDSIAAFDAALDRAPDDVGALNNKGSSLQRLADLQAALSQHPQAQQSYTDSIAAYNAALDRAPDYVMALNNKGLSLSSLADLQAALSQHPQAQQSYTDAIAAFDAALDRAPDLVQALNNKGLSLSSLADLQAALSQHQQAQQTYTDSIAAYNAALDRAPDDMEVLNNKGNSLQRLADLQAALSQHPQAQQSYTDAIAAYNAALDRAPDYVMALNNKGNSLKSLADLQAALSQHPQAQQSYTDAIAAYDAALDRAPDYVMALNNKGLTCIKWGVLCSQRSEAEEAGRLIQSGLACWNRSLALAPGNTALREQRDRLLAMFESDNSSETE